MGLFEEREIANAEKRLTERRLAAAKAAGIRPADEADDLQEREQFLKDQGVDHEENDLCALCDNAYVNHRAKDNACPKPLYKGRHFTGFYDDMKFDGERK